MKKHIHVVGAVIIENGKILCAQRGATKSLANKWEFPGGKVEEGESLEAALKREIDEEMNCSIDIGDKIETTIHEYEFGYVHLTTFYCYLKSGQPRLTEHTAIRWLSPHELMTLDWAPADIPAVIKIQESLAKAYE